MNKILSGIELFLDVVSLSFLIPVFDAFGWDDEPALNLLHMLDCVCACTLSFPPSLCSIPVPLNLWFLGNLYWALFH